MGSLRRWADSRVPLVLIPVLVLGCGGSGGGTARGKNPASAPQATITFPPAGALTDASVVTVTGTASDVVDGVFVGAASRRPSVWCRNRPCTGQGRRCCEYASRQARDRSASQCAALLLPVRWPWADLF